MEVFRGRKTSHLWSIRGVAVNQEDAIKVQAMAEAEGFNAQVRLVEAGHHVVVIEQNHVKETIACNLSCLPRRLELLRLRAETETV
jgi:hypothetical protein